MENRLRLPFLSRQSPAGDPALVRLRATQRLEKSGKIKTGIVLGNIPAFKKEHPGACAPGWFESG
jgi:hypothetical protein